MTDNKRGQANGYSVIRDASDFIRALTVAIRRQGHDIVGAGITNDRILFSIGEFDAQKISTLSFDSLVDDHMTFDEIATMIVRGFEEQRNVRFKRDEVGLVEVPLQTGDDQ